MESQNKCVLDATKRCATKALITLWLFWSLMFEKCVYLIKKYHITRTFGRPLSAGNHGNFIMHEKVTSKITDFPSLLWLSRGRISGFLPFFKIIKWSSEISLQCDVFQAWIFWNENSSSSWRWSTFTDFSYDAIRHSFCRVSRQRGKTKEATVDHYHGVTDFWTIGSISRHEYYFHSQFHGVKFYP